MLSLIRTPCPSCFNAGRRKEKCVLNQFILPPVDRVRSHRGARDWPCRIWARRGLTFPRAQSRVSMEAWTVGRNNLQPIERPRREPKERLCEFPQSSNGHLSHFGFRSSIVKRPSLAGSLRVAIFVSTLAHCSTRTRTLTLTQNLPLPTNPNPKPNP